VLICSKHNPSRAISAALFAAVCGLLLHAYFENLLETPWLAFYVWALVFIGGTENKSLSS